MNIIGIDVAAALPDAKSSARPTDVRTAPSTAPENTTLLVHDWSNRGDRERMIAEAAYFRAERRGFGLGEAEIDWFEAERELTARMETDRLPQDD